MTTASAAMCRIDVVGAIERPDDARHYAALAERARERGGACGPDPVLADRLIAEEATLYLLRDTDGRTRAACHTLRDGRGITHIRGLIKVDEHGVTARECVALAVVYQSALGYAGFTADVVETGRRTGPEAAAFRILADLGFETFAIVDAPASSGRDAAGRPFRTRIVNSTRATMSLARAALSSVVRIL